MSGTITINSTDLANAVKPQLLQMPEITRQSYSYIIWTDGTNYYAKNGATGQIDFSGTDASTVIQLAIDSTATGGEVYVKGDISLKNTVNMSSYVTVTLDGTVYIDADVDGFVFNGTRKATLRGGLIKVRASTFTHSAIKITAGGEARGNSVKDIEIQLPSSGYGIQIYLNDGNYAIGNRFERIMVYNPARGVYVQMSDSSVAVTNYFEDVWIWYPTQYGFSIENGGYAFGGNRFISCWTEIGFKSNVSAFHFKLTGYEIRNNTFIDCHGYDYGTSNSYFAIKDPNSTSSPVDNIWIGCDSAYLKSSDDFPRDTWIDRETIKTTLAPGSGLIEQVLKPPLSNMDSILRLKTTKANAMETKLMIENLAVDLKEYLAIRANGSAFQIFVWRSSGYTLRPLVFAINDAGIWTEIARIDTDKNFKFSSLVIPTSPPTTPVIGSMYFDSSTSKLYIYDGTAWRSVSLT